MEWTKNQLVAIIGAVLVLVFVIVWGVLIWEVWRFTPTEEVPLPVFGEGAVLIAGLLATTIGSLTSASLGFSIAEVKANAQANATQSGAGETPPPVTAAAIGQAVGAGAAWAVIAYLAVGVAVLFVFLLREAVAPEFFSAFALSAVGWILGGGSVALRSTSPSGQ
ncbi:hypothetical protein QL996_09815 [Planococcus sp. APC 4015]|nr:hypothetical protein [Planococcus sp. APC 4015]